MLSPLLCLLALLAACSSAPQATQNGGIVAPQPTEAPTTGSAATTSTGQPPATGSLAGMPAVTDPHNVYAAAGAGMVSDAVKADKPLVYVPHTKSGDVWVIDPTTFQVVGKYPAGKELQHVVPSYDMRTL